MYKLVVCLALASIAVAQVDGITTTTSRTITLNPEEVTFQVAVLTALGTTLEQAVATVREAGITATNLMSISNTQEYYPEPPDAVQRSSRLLYLFLVTHPYSKLKEISDKLDAAQRAVVAENGDVQVGLMVSPAAKAIDEARRQVVPQLIAEARQQAEFLAGAANMTLGPLLSVSESVYAGASSVPGPGPYYGAIGYFSSGSYPASIRSSFSVFTRFEAKPK